MVLDLFAGSGTTLVAAERGQREARLLECDPAWCDVIVRRYQDLTGGAARLGTGKGPTFAETAKTRKRER